MNFFRFQTIVIAVRHIVLLVTCCVFSFGFFSCGNASDNRSSIDSINQNNVVLDSAVNSIILRDTNSVIARVGDVTRFIIEDINMGECIVLTNRFKSEFLVMVREYGGYSNLLCYYYLVKHIEKADESKLVVLEDSIFVSSNGAYLGMTQNSFLEKYTGVSLAVVTQGTRIVYAYSIENEMYMSKYIFENNELIEIEFGYQW